MWIWSENKRPTHPSDKNAGISSQAAVCHLDRMGSMYGIFTYIPQKSAIHAGKYTNPMDPMGMYQLFSAETFLRQSGVISIPCPGDIPIRGFIIVTFPKHTRCFFWCDLCQISNMLGFFIFPFSPRSQELLVSDLWFTVSQFWANDFIFLFFHLFILPHFTQIEDRKSAGAFFVFLLSHFCVFTKQKGGCSMAAWHCFGLPNSGANRMGWAGCLFGWSWCWWWIQKSGLPKTTEAHRMFFNTKKPVVSNGIFQKFPSSSGACVDRRISETITSMGFHLLQPMWSLGFFAMGAPSTRWPHFNTVHILVGQVTHVFSKANFSNQQQRRSYSTFFREIKEVFQPKALSEYRWIVVDMSTEGITEGDNSHVFPVFWLPDFSRA